MNRRVAVTVIGCLAGLLVGLLGFVVFVAACVWDDRTDWSALTDRRSLPFWAVAGVAGALNGLIGVRDGLHSHSRRQRPVCWLPILPLAFPCVLFLQYPGDSKGWGALLFILVFFGLFVWVAGRLGQDIGVTGSRRSRNRRESAE